jgi:hypothetical protein
VQMTFCTDGSVAHKPISGILLQYGDGHRDCIGQFRWDKSLEKVQVDATAALHIGSRRTTGSFLYVADVLTSPPSDPNRDELYWMEVSWDGILEWWSSGRDSVLRFTSAKGQVTNMEARV